MNNAGSTVSSQRSSSNEYISADELFPEGDAEDGELRQPNSSFDNSPHRLRVVGIMEALRSSWLSTPDRIPNMKEVVIYEDDEDRKPIRHIETFSAQFSPTGDESISVESRSDDEDIFDVKSCDDIFKPTNNFKITVGGQFSKYEKHENRPVFGFDTRTFGGRSSSEHTLSSKDEHLKFRSRRQRNTTWSIKACESESGEEVAKTASHTVIGDVMRKAVSVITVENVLHDSLLSYADFQKGDVRFAKEVIICEESAAEFISTDELLTEAKPKFVSTPYPKRHTSNESRASKFEDIPSCVTNLADELEDYEQAKPNFVSTPYQKRHTSNEPRTSNFDDIASIVTNLADELEDSVEETSKLTMSHITNDTFKDSRNYSVLTDVTPMEISALNDDEYTNRKYDENGSPETVAVTVNANGALGSHDDQESDKEVVVDRGGIDEVKSLKYELSHVHEILEAAADIVSDVTKHAEQAASRIVNHVEFVSDESQTTREPQCWEDLLELDEDEDVISLSDFNFNDISYLKDELAEMKQTIENVTEDIKNNQTEIINKGETISVTPGEKYTHLEYETSKKDTAAREVTRSPDPTIIRSPYPIITRSPDPIITRSPDPTITRSHDPSIITRSPEPIITCSPDPIITRSPNPTITRSPNHSIITRSHDPTITCPPDSIITHSADPIIKRSPDLADHIIIRSPDPIIKRSPDPIVTRSPEPIITRSPDPAIARSLDPTITHSPDSIITSSPDTIVTHSPDPIIKRSPDPIITRSPDPIIIRSPDPTIKRSHDPTFRTKITFWEGIIKCGSKSDNSPNVSYMYGNSEQQSTNCEIEISADENIAENQIKDTQEELPFSQHHHLQVEAIEPHVKPDNIDPVSQDQTHLADAVAPLDDSYEIQDYPTVREVCISPRPKIKASISVWEKLPLRKGQKHDKVRVDLDSQSTKDKVAFFERFSSPQYSFSKRSSSRLSFMKDDLFQRFRKGSDQDMSETTSRSSDVSYVRQPNNHCESGIWTNEAFFDNNSLQPGCNIQNNTTNEIINDNEQCPSDDKIVQNKEDFNIRPSHPNVGISQLNSEWSFIHDDSSYATSNPINESEKGSEIVIDGNAEKVIISSEADVDRGCDGMDNDVYFDAGCDDVREHSAAGEKNDIFFDASQADDKHEFSLEVIGQKAHIIEIPEPCPKLDIVGSKITLHESPSTDLGDAKTSSTQPKKKKKLLSVFRKKSKKRATNRAENVNDGGEASSEYVDTLIAKKCKKSKSKNWGFVDLAADGQNLKTTSKKKRWKIFRKTYS